MNKPEWIIEYKATESFNIPDVNPQSLHSLVQKFESQEGSHFEKYYLSNSVSAGGEICDDECKAAQIFGIIKIDFDEYDKCLEDRLSVKSKTASNRLSLGTIVLGLQFSIFPLLTEFL